MASTLIRSVVGHSPFDLLDRRVLLLGVCLGARLLAAAAGAPARRAQTPEIGWYPVELTSKASHDPVLGPLAPRFDALEWHSYELRLPPEATPLAHSTDRLQANRIGDVAWGIQSHAEVTLQDFESWLDHHGRLGDLADVTAEELRALTQARIAGWNDLGRGLCRRFIGRAATQRRAPPRLSPGSSRNRRQ